MDTLEMRTSERNSLKRCAQQWYWGQVEGLFPNRAATPLWFGSAVHDSLAQWYQKGSKRGTHPAVFFESLLDDEDRQTALYDPDDSEAAAVYVSAKALGIDMLTRYVDLYGKDSDWDVIATEQVGHVWLPRPEIEIFGVKQEKRKHWLRYNFTFDGVYRSKKSGEIWLMEHKTAAGIRIDHLPLDDQAGSYWTFASIILRQRGILGPDEEIAGIMYNFMRKALADPRPRNAQGQYTNKPTKQHFVDALLNHYGEDTPGDEMSEWAQSLPKMTLAELEDLASIQKLVVLGDASKSQPPAYFERTPVYRSKGERKTMITRIQDEAIFAEAYREGWLPVTKTTSKDCSWCPFRRMCELDEQGDQESVASFKQTQYIVRNPYDVYEKKSAE